MTILGWDIGGVNTKVACVTAGRLGLVLERPFELQRAPDRLTPLLRDLSLAAGATAEAAHAITLTAELSQMFRTKREGVDFVLDAVAAAFPGARMEVYSVSGRFLSVAEARREPLAVAAANWSATAHLASAYHPNALLVDVGTTTTDLIPVVGGRVAAAGSTDPERLVSGELVYSGAVRTPAEAIASEVPLAGVIAGVSAEGFALSGDVHVWRGDLASEDYAAPTPDGRPATRAYAGERLARVVCGDRDLLDTAAVDAIADALAAAQTARIAAAMKRILSRHPPISTAVVMGTGHFIGRAAARACGLKVVTLADALGAAARCAPAACVALLLAERMASDAAGGREALPDAQPAGTPASGDTPPPVVVKIGGGMLSDVAAFDAVLDAIASLATGAPLVVPGGGPFADTVRAQNGRIGLSDDAAHWMAVLAMEQYAHLIAGRLRGALLIEDRQGMRRAFREGRVPVLAPYRWLREADPLPHSWDVTSDSIAAWVARRLGARQLVLVKPAGARGPALMDPYFETALGSGLRAAAVGADQLDLLRQVVGRVSEA